MTPPCWQTSCRDSPCWLWWHKRPSWRSLYDKELWAFSSRHQQEAKALTRSHSLTAAPTLFTIMLAAWGLNWSLGEEAMVMNRPSSPAGLPPVLQPHPSSSLLPPHRNPREISRLHITHIETRQEVRREKLIWLLETNSHYQWFTWVGAQICIPLSVWD